MATNNNLTDLLQDVADAIREKKGTSELINPQDFAKEIKSIEGDGGGGTTPSRPTYTGHADAEGLRAIGWDDDDIAYYQEHGVNWNEEDDQYHLVSDDNKALYGVLTASNISTYKERIVYLPKIDTSSVTSMSSMFYSCYSLVSIPKLNTSKVRSMSYMFYDCYSLVSIPELDTSRVTSMSYMFDGCNSLVSIPELDTSSVTSMSSMFQNCSSLVSIPKLNTSKVTDMSYMFYGCNSLVSIPELDTSRVTSMSYMFDGCNSLVSIPELDTSSVTSMSSMFQNCSSLVSIPKLNTSKVTDMSYMFYGCNSLVSIPELDTSRVTSMSYMFQYCSSLTHVNLKNAKLAYQLHNSALLSKESLLYLINNEVATSAITIKLASYAYTRLAEDADVVAALANHPNISLAK